MKKAIPFTVITATMLICTSLVPVSVDHSNDCRFKEFNLYGKVQFVNSFPDIKIQYVNSFPDIKVKFVSAFPDDCGEWQVVDSFPDFKVQIVESFPDLKVQVVESFPGMN